MVGDGKSLRAHIYRRDNIITLGCEKKNVFASRRVISVRVPRGPPSSYVDVITLRRGRLYRTKKKPNRPT